jgi:hypothetical protein
MDAIVEIMHVPWKTWTCIGVRIKRVLVPRRAGDPGRVIEGDFPHDFKSANWTAPLCFEIPDPNGLAPLVNQTDRLQTPPPDLLHFPRPAA